MTRWRSGSDPPLRALLPGWSVTTDALKSRPTSVGVAIIDRQPSLPGSLVVELGTNDSPDQTARFAGYVRHVLQVAGPNRCVVWVNIHRPPYNGVSYAGFNRALDQIAATSPNLAVVDWNGMVKSGQAQVAGDGVHATPAGYQRARGGDRAGARGLLVASSRASGSHTIAPAKKHIAPRHRRRAPRRSRSPAGRSPRRSRSTQRETAAAAPPRRRPPRRPPTAATAPRRGTSHRRRAARGPRPRVARRRFLRTMRGPRRAYLRTIRRSTASAHPPGVAGALGRT